jgi:hypothetical protein
MNGGEDLSSKARWANMSKISPRSLASVCQKKKNDSSSFLEHIFRSNYSSLAFLDRISLANESLSSMSHLQSLLQHFQLLQPNLSQGRPQCSIIDIISFNTNAILSTLQVPTMFLRKNQAPSTACFRTMGI